MIDDLKKTLQEKISNLERQHLKLIEEDAAKNKFTVMAGKLLAYMDIQDEITSLEQKARTPQE